MIARHRDFLPEEEIGIEGPKAIKKLKKQIQKFPKKIRDTAGIMTILPLELLIHWEPDP